MDQEFTQTEKALAKAMFQVYNDDAGGKTWDSKDIPLFENTGMAVQHHWFAVARFVLQWAAKITLKVYDLE